MYAGLVTPISDERFEGIDGSFESLPPQKELPFPTVVPPAGRAVETTVVAAHVPVQMPPSGQAVLAPSGSLP